MAALDGLRGRKAGECYSMARDGKPWHSEDVGRGHECLRSALEARFQVVYPACAPTTHLCARMHSSWADRDESGDASLTCEGKAGLGANTRIVKLRPAVGMMGIETGWELRRAGGGISHGRAS